MYLGLLLILLPLLLGYLIVVKSDIVLKKINQSCSYMVYLILFLMGISLSQLDNLAHNAATIVGYSGVFILNIVSLNLIGLYFLDKKQLSITKTSITPAIKKMPLVLESLQLLAVVSFGFFFGLAGALVLDIDRSVVDTASEWALMLLLGLIGCQLRNSGIALRDILLNKQGMLIALVVMITSWLGGLLTSVMLSLPSMHGLAVSSGFGWYSLSGILISDGISAVMGGVAFINDLARELIAILLIPLIIRRYQHCAIGVAGATSMDFTLPIIQKSGGTKMVPLAIVSGFILTLASPLFILMFVNLAKEL